MGWSPKDPADESDYWFDWGSTNIDLTRRFLAPTVTIASETVTVTPDLVKVDDDFDDKTVRFRVSGGMNDIGYPVTCQITTSDGQTFNITRTLQVRERTT